MHNVHNLHKHRQASQEHKPLQRFSPTLATKKAVPKKFAAFAYPMITPRTLPGPGGHWLLGSLPRLRTDMLGFFEECFREHGDAAYFRVANRRSMLLSHPDDIERVLVTENRHFIKNYALIFLRPLLGNGLLLNEGKSWLRQRRIIQPAFGQPRVQGYVPAMAECTERVLREWQGGETLDIAAAMMRLTMTIAGRTL